MRLEAGLDALLHDFARGVVGPDDDRGADELLGLVERLALEDEEAEEAVRFSADAEDRGVREGLAAEVHRRADPAVGVHAHDRAGVLARQRAGRRAAVPEGDRVLALVERDGIAEEDRLAAQAHADPHRQRAVDVGLAGGGHALVVEHGQHGAHGRAEGGEEIRPAAGGQRADTVLAHVIAVRLQKPRVVEAVVLGRFVQPAGRLRGLFQVFRAFLIGKTLCFLDQFARLDRLELDAEGVHQLAVQRAAEAEALRRVSDGGHLQAAHLLFDRGGPDDGRERVLHALLLG